MRKFAVFLVILLLMASPTMAQEQEWLAWLFDADRNEFVLLDQSGEIGRLPAPTTPEQAENEVQYFTISPDGAYIAMMSYTEDGRPLVVLQDLFEGDIAAWTGMPGEAMLPTIGSEFRLPPLSFSPDSTFFAAGVGNPIDGTWRVVLLDSDAGQPIAELNALEAAEATNVEFTGFIVPNIRLVNENSIQIQLFRADSMLLEENTTIRWEYDTDAIEKTAVQAGVMNYEASNTEGLFLFRDESLPLPPAGGFFPPYNAIRSTGSPDENLLATAPNELFQGARWAANGRAVLVRIENQDVFEQFWRVVDIETGSTFDLAPNILDVQGTPDGFLSLTEDGVVGFHPINDPANVQILTEIGGRAEIIWVG